MSPTAGYPLNSIHARAETHVDSTAPPLGAVIGIVFGGSFGILIISASFVVYLLRRKDRLERARIQSTEASIVHVEAKEPARTFPLVDPLGIPRLHSLSSGHCCGKDDGSIQWLTGDVGNGMSIASVSSKGLFSSKGLTWLSGKRRQSWTRGSTVPIPNNSLPLTRLQPPSTGTLEQIAPSSHLDPSLPKWLARTCSKTSKTKVYIGPNAHNPNSFSTNPYEAQEVASLPQIPPMPRRVAPGTQFSTILRSTSERLKSARKQALSRTLTTLSQLPGLPPTERLPTPPRKPVPESRMVSDDATSIISSIFGGYLSRSPSPERKVPRTAGCAFPRQNYSPSTSILSDDSLCPLDVPDLAMPAPFTPGGLRGEQRYRMRVSSDGSKAISAPIHKDSRTSVLEPYNQADTIDASDLSISAKVSLANDPFYSSVKRSKSAVPVFQPRPLYIRKAMFGLEASWERYSGSISPLEIASDNAQSPSRRRETTQSSPISKGAELNPFQWYPQKPMDPRPVLANQKRAGSPRKKGHQRSNVVRISGIPRPSSVGEVPEGSEEHLSSMKNDIPNTPIGMTEPSKTACFPLKSVPRSLSCHPPSTAIFNPSVTVPELLPGRSLEDSPTLGVVTFPPKLAIRDHSVEASGSISDSRTNESRHQSLVLSGMVPNPAFFVAEPSSGRPDLPSNSEIMESIEERPLSLPVSISSSTAVQRPSPSLTSILPTNSPMSSGTLGRRGDMSMRNSVSSIYSEYQASPAQPVFARSPSVSPQPRNPRAGSAEGGSVSDLSSGHFLSLRLKSGAPKKKVEKQISARLISEIRRRERRRSQLRALSWNGEQRLKLAGVSSLATRPGQPDSLGSKFSTSPIDQWTLRTSHDVSMDTNPYMELVREITEHGKVNEIRWSDAMIRHPLQVTSRQSKWEYPSPQLPPQCRWEMESKIMPDLTSEDGPGKENIGDENTIAMQLKPSIYGNWNGNHGRPDSLGLYDSEGFLKSSPDRRGALGRG